MSARLNKANSKPVSATATGGAQFGQYVVADSYGPINRRYVLTRMKTCP
jgi:hypothetical protein